MAKDINVSITAGKEEEGLFYDLVTVKEKLDNLPHIPGEDDDVRFRSVATKDGFFADNGTISGHDVYNLSEDYTNFETDQCVTKGWISWYFGNTDYAHLGGTNTFTGLNTFTRTATFNDAEFETIEVAGNATLNGDVSIHKATLQESQAVASLRSNDLVTKGTTDSLISRMSVDYDSDDKLLLLRYNGTVISEQDARPFIKDGMVDRVYLDGAGNLVISFNTDAGKENISIPLDQIFNPNNYYTKTDVDNIVDGIYGEGPCDDYDTLTKCQAGFEDVYATKVDFLDNTSQATNMDYISNGVGAKATVNADATIGTTTYKSCGLTFKAGTDKNQFISKNSDASDVWCRTLTESLASRTWRRIKASLGNIYTGEDVNIANKGARFVRTKEEFIDAMLDATIEVIYIAANEIDCGETDILPVSNKFIIGMSFKGKPALTARIVRNNYESINFSSLYFVNLRYSPYVATGNVKTWTYLFDCIEVSSMIGNSSGDIDFTCAYHYNCLIEGNSDSNLLSGKIQGQVLYDCTVINNGTGGLCGDQLNPKSRGNTFMLPNQSSGSRGNRPVLGRIVYESNIGEVPYNRCTESDILKRDNTIVFADGRREAPKGITLHQQGVLVGGYYDVQSPPPSEDIHEYYHHSGKIFYIGGDPIHNMALPSITEGSENDCPLLFRMIEQRQTINLQTGLDNLNLTIEGPSLHGNGGMADIGYGTGERGINIVNRKMDDDDEYTEGKVNLRLENLDVRGTVQVVSGSEGKVVIKNCHFSRVRQLNCVSVNCC